MVEEVRDCKPRRKDATQATTQARYVCSCGAFSTRWHRVASRAQRAADRHAKTGQRSLTL